MSVLIEAATTARHFVDLPTILVAMSTCLLSYLYLQRHRNLPPGPWPWPVLGNIPYLMWLKPQFGPTFLTDLSKTYGDVICFRIASKLHVVISGHEAIRHALVTRADDFSSRKVPPTTAYIRGDGTSSKAAKGVLFAEYGPDWRQQRRFALKTLRDFGVGKRSLEGKICEEAAALSQELVAKDGEPFNIKHLLQNSVSNIICSIVFGKRFEYGDPEFLRIITLLNKVVETKPDRDILINIHPIFRHIPFVSQEEKKLTKNTLEMQEFCRQQVQQHRETFDPNDIRDFIDAFLLEQRHAGGDQTQNGFTDKQLQEVLLDLFLAGTETTSTAISWALFDMLLYPDVQEKVHQEIDSVLGQAVPSYSLRDKMPYTTATLAEVQRINTILPYSVPHATSTDTTLNGYSIPEDAIILVNLWSVHMDPQLFPEPDKFNPGRFLDQDGNFTKHPALISFSIGPRVCLGEQLARMELFVLFVSLMQRFTFQLPEGAPALSTPGKMTALINMPHPYKLCAVPRG